MRQARTLLAAFALIAVSFGFAQDIGSCAPSLRLYAHDLTAAAAEFSVPAPLLAAVALVESAGDPAATRYEPGFPLSGNWDAATSLGWTAQDLRTSYGLMQIVGAVAFRELHAHDPPSALLKPGYNLRLGARLLAALFAEWGDWGDAIAAYNGGAAAARALESGTPFNAEYVSRVFDRWASIQACEDGR